MMVTRTVHISATTTGTPLVPALFLLALVLICACDSRPGYANTLRLTDDEAIQAGRDALRKRARFPWYDSQEDSLRPITTTPHREVDARNRSSNWENNWTMPKMSSPNVPAWIPTAFRYVAIGLLVVAIITLLFFVVRAFLQSDLGPSPSRAKRSDADPSVGDAARIENLPFELRAPHGDLLTEARRLYEQGNYRLAIVYLFSHQLLFLDRHQLIRLTKGKTNRQYLREIRRKVPVVRQAVERTMVAFEDVFFGDHPLDRNRFEACWMELDAFHSRVQEANA